MGGKHRAPRATVVLAVLLFICCSVGHPQCSWSSPYRAFFPRIETISTAELHDQLFTSTLVDVRSRFEFDVVHIARSINLPLETGQFADRIGRLVPVQDDLQLVLIGNDPDCSRAFEAAGIARSQGISQVRVYDAGVFSWLHAHPERTRLMGESPARLEVVLPLTSHHQRRLSFEQLLAEAEKPQSIVIDVRNFYQRHRVPRDLPYRAIETEALLTAIGDRIWANQRLLIIDEDGSRSRWLHLFLRAAGFSDFSFLEGGMNGIPLARQTLIAENVDESISINQQRLRDSLSTLWELGQTSEFLTYVLSCLRRENIAFVQAIQAAAQLDITVEQIRELSRNLSTGGQARFFDAGEYFVYQVDPLLAWKGDQRGLNWQRRVSQYHQRYPSLP